MEHRSRAPQLLQYGVRTPRNGPGPLRTSRDDLAEPDTRPLVYPTIDYYSVQYGVLYRIQYILQCYC